MPHHHAADHVHRDDHQPAHGETGAEPANRRAPVCGHPDRSEREQHRHDRNNPRCRVDAPRDSHEIEHDRPRVQSQERRHTLGAELLRRAGCKPRERSVDQYGGVPDADEDRATVLMCRCPVRIQHAPSKQRGKRLGADDRTGESPDRGPHRDEVAAATIDECIGQVIGDVVLHGLVAERRHGAVGERLRPQHRAPQVRHHQREQRQHHSNAAERPIHGMSR